MNYFSEPSVLCDLPVSELDTREQLRHAALAVVSRTPDVPLPGKGLTHERWRFFSDLGHWDLCLFKILEAHYDAVAILSELGHTAPGPGELWGVWAAEMPGAGLIYSGNQDGQLSGKKSWCSGASIVTHALVTVRRSDARSLAAVSMRAPGLEIDASSWKAVGMSRVETPEVTFSHVQATLVADDCGYLNRPGFSHGGAGIAAGWLGGARAVAETLRRAKRTSDSPHALAHLGAIDTALSVNAVFLKEVARRIDEAPQLPHDRAVLQLRTSVDMCCEEVLSRTGRALGAGPLCMDGAHARRVSDLMVFTRQAHAERDLQSLGEAAVADVSPWRQ